MGDDLASPFDNIKAQKMGGAYDILNKKANLHCIYGESNIAKFHLRQMYQM